MTIARDGLRVDSTVSFGYRHLATFHEVDSGVIFKFLIRNLSNLGGQLENLLKAGVHVSRS